MNVERTLAEWEDGSGRGSVRARVCSASEMEGGEKREGEREKWRSAREREREQPRTCVTLVDATSSFPT